MQTETVHCSVSVLGALTYWKTRDWQKVADENKCTVKDVKHAFRALNKAGIKFIPLSDRCENFSDETGCPGHLVETKEAKA